MLLRPTSEEQETARHESGHALLYLLHDYAIRAWSVRPQGNQEGFIDPAAYLRNHDHNLKITLAGEAATDRKQFWKRRHLGKANIENPETDIDWTVFCISQLLGKKPAAISGTALHRVVDISYQTIRRILNTAPFPEAILTLERYMLCRKEERDFSGRITKSMLTELRQNGIEKRQRAAMRALLDKVNFREILTRETFHLHKK